MLHVPAPASAAPVPNPAVTADAPAPALVAYKEWLRMEHRLLSLQSFPWFGVRAAEVAVPSRAALAFHFPVGQPLQEAPLPASRAATVLDLLGVDWRSDDHRDTPASIAEPDARLGRLGREWEEAHAEEQAFLQTLKAAEERYQAQCPEPPTALTRRREDWGRFGGLASHLGSPRYDGDDVEFLRTFTADGFLHERDRAAALARAQEIVGAWDRWQRDLDAARESSGLTAATAEFERLCDRTRSLRIAVCRLHATTFAGVLIKVRIAASLWGQIATLDSALKEDLDAGRAYDETVALAILNDLWRLAGIPDGPLPGSSIPEGFGDAPAMPAVA